MFRRAVVVLVALLACGVGLRAQDTPRIWQGVYTTAQAERGKAIFNTTCLRCHGEDLAGNTAPALKGDRFQTSWGGDVVESLFTKVRDTMPPNFGTILDDQVKLDIVTYILQTNGFPAGNSDLLVGSADLATTQILKKGEQATVQNFSLVQTVGCLATGPNNTWMLTRTAEPLTTRDEAPSDRGLATRGITTAREQDVSTDQRRALQARVAHGSEDGSTRSHLQRARRRADQSHVAQADWRELQLAAARSRTIDSCLCSNRVQGVRSGSEALVDRRTIPQAPIATTPRCCAWPLVCAANTATARAPADVRACGSDGHSACLGSRAPAPRHSSSRSHSSCRRIPSTSNGMHCDSKRARTDCGTGRTDAIDLERPAILGRCLVPESPHRSPTRCDGTSPSSRTSTMARRPSSTRCCGKAVPFVPISRWPIG